MRRLLIGLVTLYQKAISPLLPPMCRFDPSCSRYSKAALARHGAIKGSLLTIWRLLRCQPFYRGPRYDPVPPQGRWRPERDGATPVKRR